jgi:hypothetical protein
LIGAVLMFVAAAALITAAVNPSDQGDPGQARVSPKYGADGALLLPEDYRRWVFVGASLGLSYSEGARGMEMFHETLMEPTAYDHFVKTGAFREGTMLVLLLHGTGERVMPARHGKFAADVHGVEMAVKDSSRRPEGWAYYNFGGMSGLRRTAQAMPKEGCYNCHVQHARRDNVFIQFYPLLAEAAHLPAAAPAAVPHPPVAAAPLALGGLDPVLLATEAREEKGKPEIVASHGPYQYQFVSEPNRARFAAEPAKFSIQNATCPVVPGAPVDPSVFAVHEGRIYAFASNDCVGQFKAGPSTFIKGPE